MDAITKLCEKIEEISGKKYILDISGTFNNV